LSAVPFPFLTWAGFEAEFRLRFVEENEQDQALAKLESHSYLQGSHDVYWYMDNFKELAAMARYTDVLVQVTKYHLGLDLQVNVAIMTSSETVTTGLAMKYSQTKPCKLICGLICNRSTPNPIILVQVRGSNPV
jgi:hypothetical protein